MTAPESGSPTRPTREVLGWLVRLRWLAVAGLGACWLGALWVAPGEAAYGWVALVLGATALSNLWLGARAASARAVPEAVLGATLLGDALALTAILAASGGPDNPLAVLYVVHVALAAVIGGPRWAWAVAALVVAGYGVQFQWHVRVPLWHLSVSLPFGRPVMLHMLGMWCALLVVAVVVTWFVQRIRSARDAHAEALRAAQQRLARSQHLASLTTLAAGAAHELGSPLATVAVIARELERSAEREGADELREEAGAIRDQVERCREILARMSAGVARGLGDAPGRGAADDFAAELLRELGDDAGRVRLDPGQARPGLEISAAQLAQLVLPLVRNGLDASSADGRVDVRLRSDAERLCVEVVDAGSGMPQPVLARAVEPFFTTKPPGSGTGLGLHLVRLVSEVMGGSLDLESEPGRGTRAVLTLPLGHDGAPA